MSLPQADEQCRRVHETGSTMMAVNWVTNEGELYTAQTIIGPERAIHLAVESLGDSGWDWHVWDATLRGRQRYGLADTLDHAQAEAEAALAEVAAQLSQAAQSQEPPAKTVISGPQRSGGQTGNARL